MNKHFGTVPEMKRDGSGQAAPNENKYRETIPGVVFCLLIAFVAFMLGKTLPVVGGSVFGILLGILAGRLLRRRKEKPCSVSMKNGEPGHCFLKSIEQVITLQDLTGKTFMAGIRFTSKKLLQSTIILLGFEMNMVRVLQVGMQSLSVMIFTLAAAFLTAWLMGKAFGIASNEKILVGVGTTICGGSAIAATAPVIQAKDEEAAHAISTIVKLTRTLMIVPVTLVLAIHTARKNKNGKMGAFSLRYVFPWFVPGFIFTGCMHPPAHH